MTGLTRAIPIACIVTFMSIVDGPLHQTNDPTDSILSTKIAHFELQNQTLFDGVANLSAERIPLTIGFEDILKAKFADPPLQNPRFSVELVDTTVKEIVDRLCTIDNRYTWSLDEGTLNVYPRAVIADQTYFLNRHLPSLDLEKITTTDQGLLAIANQLSPPHEQIAIAQVGGDDSYPLEPWTAVFENITVRQAINRLAAHMGPRSQWVFSGSRDFRSFAFFKAGFNPRPAPNPEATQPY